jgi:hypothetical protein
MRLVITLTTVKSMNDIEHMTDSYISKTVANYATFYNLM